MGLSICKNVMSARVLTARLFVPMEATPLIAFPEGLTGWCGVGIPALGAVNMIVPSSKPSQSPS